MKLFLVTRSDLPPGQQAVQAAHALREFVSTHPELDKEWYERSNTLALLVVQNEEALGNLLMKATSKKLPSAPFYEPDRSNELTAIAFGPACKKLVASLPLAFSGIQS